MEGNKKMKRIAIWLVCFIFVVGCSNTDIEKDKGSEKVEKDTSVSFLGVGDNLIHDTIYKQARQTDDTYNFKSMYDKVEKDIKKSDISFINQETILGGTELGLSGYPMFNSPSEMAADLNAVGFNLVNLATNHCLDKGEIGISNTKAAFNKQKDMVVNGIYTNQEDYDAIPTFKKKGITFSFLAYTYGTNGIEANNTYNVSYFDDAKITSDVEKAKSISDVVIVSAHWGNENESAPSEYQTHFSKLFADLEVDAVIGTHPHVIQPITWESGVNGNKTLVVYSLGNFLGGMLTSDNVISGMVKFNFVKDSKAKDIAIKNVKWVPTLIHFEGNKDNILEERYNYKIYKVSQYSDELASKHVLNGYEGNVISLDYIYNKTKAVIDASFLD